ncbi:MAG: hypothetical protein ABJO57_14460 [Lentilitoribacter sp.]
MIQPRNRNQSRSQLRKGNAADKMTPDFNLKKRYHDARKVFDTGDFLKNFAADLWEYARILYANPGQAIPAIVSFLGSLISVYQILFPDAPTTRSFSNPNSIWNSLPAQFFIFIFVVACLSWTTSMICILLTARVNEIRFMAARALSGLAAILSVMAIQWSFNLDVSHGTNTVFVYAILGMALASFLAKTCFRYTKDPDPVIMAERAGLLLIYAVTTIVMVMWARWGVYING